MYCAKDQTMIWFLTVVSMLLFIIPYSQANGLKAVVAVFRHGDKTTDVKSCYPKDPYLNLTYSPYGIGELTFKGRRRAVQLGRQLRKRYGKFVDVLDKTGTSAVSTNYNRTKDTLQIVMNTLFNNANYLDVTKPLRKFNFEVVTVKNESLLHFPFFYCLHYRKLFDIYEESQSIHDKYLPGFSQVNEMTGINATRFHHLAPLYQCLRSEEEWGLTLPTWSSTIYPEYLKDCIVDFFTMSVALPELNKLYGGFLLKEILNNMYLKMTDSIEKKLYLYSAHDINVVGLLGALEIYRPHEPFYGACVVMELHEIRKTHYVKVLYQQNPIEGFKELSLPGCHTLCRLEKLKKIVERNIPRDNDNCSIDDS